MKGQVSSYHKGNIDLTSVAVGGRKRLQKGATSAAFGKNAQWMEEERKNIQAYEYLCHIGEAKE
jgi:Ras GTPase-activating-like protein IQGAP2/3